MKYVSWNVNSVRIRMPMIRNFLESENPDVLMLQELKCVDTDFPHDSFPEYNCYVWGQKSYNGVGVLLKKNIDVLDVQRISLGGQNHSRCLQVKIPNCTVICVYVPCGSTEGTMYEFKKQFLYDLNDYMTNLKDERVILGGDFNVAVTDEDVEYPKEYRQCVLCMEDFRQPMRLLLQQNLRDIVDPKQYSWWDYRSPHHGVRIDMVLARGVQGKQFIRAPYRRMTISEYQIHKGKSKLVETKPSDHVPVVFIEC